MPEWDDGINWASRRQWWSPNDTLAAIWAEHMAVKPSTRTKATDWQIISVTDDEIVILMEWRMGGKPECEYRRFTRLAAK